MPVSLNFRMQKQSQPNWAWAAVAVSVQQFYSSRATATQCALANWAFKQVTCCADGSTSACNRMFPVRDALKHVDALKVVVPGSMSFSDIKKEIDAHRVVCVEIEWGTEKARHCMVICGYNQADTDPTILIEDPFYGSSELNLRAFPANYHGGKAWTESCLTRP